MGLRGFRLFKGWCFEFCGGFDLFNSVVVALFLLRMWFVACVSCFTGCFWVVACFLWSLFDLLWLLIWFDCFRVDDVDMLCFSLVWLISAFGWVCCVGFV